MNNKLVELKNVSKSFDGEIVLSNVSLYINDKEFITLLGPSGCGKTTTLRIIGGFESADEGDVIFDGERINDIPPYKRSVNTVFQKYALFPHLNVYDNIAFGLRVAKVKDAEIKERVSEMLSLVNLRGFEKRNVSLLSGGQQQRVAIARALIFDAPVLLLDECTSALDGETESKILSNIRNMETKTVVIITHRPKALDISDSVLRIENGKMIKEK